MLFFLGSFGLSSTLEANLPQIDKIYSRDVMAWLRRFNVIAENETEIETEIKNDVQLVTSVDLEWAGRHVTRSFCRSPLDGSNSKKLRAASILPTHHSQFKFQTKLR
jgi:hypothetical protein